MYAHGNPSCSVLSSVHPSYSLLVVTASDCDLRLPAPQRSKPAAGRGWAISLARSAAARQLHGSRPAARAPAWRSRTSSQACRVHRSLCRAASHSPRKHWLHGDSHRRRCGRDVVHIDHEGDASVPWSATDGAMLDASMSSAHCIVGLSPCQSLQSRLPGNRVRRRDTKQERTRM